MESGKLKNIKTKLCGFLGKSASTKNLKYLLLLTFHFSLITFCAFAQELPPEDELPPPPEYVAPPPLKMISKIEKSSLEAQTDVSERTKLSVSLMEIRLKSAEDLYAQNSFDRMFGELGGFHALIDETLDFLKKNDDGRSKVLNNYKRLELSLRKFSPRIELLRRDLPVKYEYWVRGLIKNVRVARSKAVEPLFGNSVVPNEKEN